MADPRLRIEYPDGGVQMVPLPAGPCVKGKAAHQWEGSVDFPRTGTGERDAQGQEKYIVHEELIGGVRAECAICHGAVGRTLFPPVEGNVIVEIV